MDSYEKYCKLIDILGAGVVLDEFYNKFSCDTANEYLDDIARDYDIDFGDEYGEEYDD